MAAVRTLTTLLVGGSLLLPIAAWADPEVWLVVGPIATAADVEPSNDAFRPEAGAVLLHERDVVTMPTCDAPLSFGLRPAPDASLREQILVRLLQRRTASGCALDVLTVATAGRRGTAAPSTSGTSSAPPSAGDTRDQTGRSLPCGTRLITLREGRTRGSRESLAGVGQTGSCAERTADMPNPLTVYWLTPPSAHAVAALMRSAPYSAGASPTARSAR